jgi:hypothetical protein
MAMFIEKMTKMSAKKRQKSIQKLQITFMSCYNQRPFFGEGLDTPNDSLSIEVAIEPLIEACLEIEEKQH